jgi:HEAT repeat protein
MAGLVQGCRSCNGEEVFAAAEAGKLQGVHELGEWAAPLVPPPGSYGLRRVDQAYLALQPHLSHENPFHRLVALEALRRLGTRTPGLLATRFPDWVDPFLEDPDPELRWRAAWTLGRVGLFRPGLFRAAGDSDPRVAERALWALGAIRSLEVDVVPVLLGALDRPALAQRAMASLRARTGLAHDTPEAWKRWAEAPPRAEGREPAVQVPEEPSGTEKSREDDSQPEEGDPQRQDRGASGD